MVGRGHAILAAQYMGGLLRLPLRCCTHQASYKANLPLYHARCPPARPPPAAVQQGSTDGWFFIKPFDWDVWLAKGELANS